jgi:acetyl esterase/lipase
MMVMRERGMPTAPDPAVTVEDVTYPSAGGPLPARIYRPANARGPLPVIVYFHGGGWVIADINVYDSTPRALAQAANAIVVSAEYRHGPEHRFPAFEDDAVAAWRWAASNARAWGGDPDRMAVAGESAGGNLAMNVAIAARDSRGAQPVAVLAVYPIANADPNLPSKLENTGARPLRTSDLMWFGQHALRSPRDMQDPRFNVVAANLRDLPPVTIVRAQIDPLRSDGETLEEALRRAGNNVEGRTFDGVTHEFFGMGSVVRGAYDANQYAVGRLRQAFDGARPDRHRRR